MERKLINVRDGQTEKVCVCWVREKGVQRAKEKRGREIERERDRLTGRQTDRQTDRNHSHSSTKSLCDQDHLNLYNYEITKLSLRG